MKRKLVTFLILSGLLLTSLFAGVAPAAETGGTVTYEEVEQFRQAVKTYWDASVNQDFSAIYDLNSNAAKSELSKEEFVADAQKKTYTRYLSHELGNIEISGRLGWAEMKLSYKYVFAMWEEPKNAKRWQAWEKTDGKWYALEETEAPSRPPSERELAEEMELARRADEFWKAREQKQAIVVYDLLDPGFRMGMPFEQFQGMKDLMSYVSHTLNWVEASNGVGRVKVTYKYRLADPSMSKMDLETRSFLENWIKVAGTWYRQVKMN